MVKKEPANVEISDVVILTTWENKLKSLYYKLFHHVVVLTTLIITVYYITISSSQVIRYINYISSSSSCARVRAREEDEDGICQVDGLIYRLHTDGMRESF